MQLRRVQPGEAVSAAAFNALVDAVNSLLGMTAGGGLKLVKHPGGIHLAAAGAWQTLRMGKLDGSLSYGGSATLSLYVGEPNSETDSGENLTASCRLLKAGEAITAGTWCFVALINGYWQVIAVSCP